MWDYLTPFQLCYEGAKKYATPKLGPLEELESIFRDLDAICIETGCAPYEWVMEEEI